MEVDGSDHFPFFSWMMIPAVNLPGCIPLFALIRRGWKGGTEFATCVCVYEYVSSM